MRVNENESMLIFGLPNIDKFISIAVCKIAWKLVVVMNWMVQHTGAEPSMEVKT